MVKKVITNLVLSKASASNFISVVGLKKCESEFSYIPDEIFNYVYQGVLFSRLLEGLVSGACIKECWGKVYH